MFPGGQARVDLHGNFRLRRDGEVPLQAVPQGLQLRGTEEGGRAAAEMDLVNPSSAQHLGESAAFEVEPGQQSVAWVVLPPPGQRHDFLGTGAVVAQLFAERDVNVERQRPGFLGRLAQFVAQILRTVAGRPHRDDRVRGVPRQRQAGVAAISLSLGIAQLVTSHRQCQGGQSGSEPHLRAFFMFPHAGDWVNSGPGTKEDPHTPDPPVYRQQKSSLKLYNPRIRGSTFSPSRCLG